MPQFIIIVTEVLFVSTLVNIVVGIKSKPKTPRGTKFVSLHENMPREVKGIGFSFEDLIVNRYSSYDVFSSLYKYIHMTLFTHLNI